MVFELLLFCDRAALSEHEQQLQAINQQHKQLGDALIGYQRELQSVLDAATQLDRDFRAIDDWLVSFDEETRGRIDSIFLDEKQVIIYRCA